MNIRDPCKTQTHYAPRAQGNVIDVVRARAVTGRERLQIHGFPAAWFEDKAVQQRITVGEFSDSFLSDLAGNSFVAFQFMAVMLATLAFLPEGLFEKADGAEQQGKEETRRPCS